MPLPLEDYALIGDCQAAALVGRDGSIDWLCLPRFDSGACFAALLGGPANGRWRIAPTAPIVRSGRRYRPDSLVLETDLTTAEGEISIIDCMPLRTEHPDLVRLVVGRRGRVPVRSELVLRFDYGSIDPWLRCDEDGAHAIAGPDAVRVRTPASLRPVDGDLIGDLTVAEGDRIPFVLSWYSSERRDPPCCDAEAAIVETERWWRDWADRCTYRGEWREAVLRSLITLKALTYMPTGGIVAAPTTSLPESLHGVRNWDYRYCWLRDATFTLYALQMAGYGEEVAAWRDWLRRAVAGRPGQPQIMYGLGGERRLVEMELPWLPGYEGSSPVRVGNLAHGQFQLDVFGEIMDAFHYARRTDPKAHEESWQMQRVLLEHLESVWRDPDEGIWEVRGPRRHFVHSKMMAWVAFDRAVKANERLGFEGPVDHWRKLRDEIHEETCRCGFDSTLGSFVQSYGSQEVDASLLMMPLVGFLPAHDPRVQGTVAAIEQRLLRDGFVYRYTSKEEVDGLPPGEATFLMCTFWLADNYTLMNRYADARAIFERMLAIRNDVGLLSEGYDRHLSRLLGNFPQAFSHVSLINTAHNLTRARGPAAQRQQS